MSKNAILKILLLFAIVASFLLSYKSITGHLLFYYDQTRDAYESYSIWHYHHLKILGPPSGINGVFHGVLWYYVISLPYFLGNNNPQITALFFSFLLLLTVPLIGYLAYSLFLDKEISMVSMLFYVLSPLFQSLTQWVSNPILGLITIPFLLILLWKYINNQSNLYALLMGFFLGLTVQANFAFIFLLFSLVLILYLFHIKFRLNQLFYFLIGLMIGTSSIWVADIKFHGLALSGILTFFKSPDLSSSSASSAFFSLFDKIVELLSLTIMPFPKLLSLIFLFIIYLSLKKYKFNNSKKAIFFLILWLSNIVIYQFFNSGAVSSAYIFIPSLGVIAILSSLILKKIVKNKRLFFTVILSLFLVQFFTSYNWFKRKYSPLAVQQGMNYQDEIKLVDYTYNKSQGKSFIINSITNPLYINTTWSYLYEFYGKKRYGYVPFWGGRSQIGYLGNLPNKSADTKYRFFIIEPPQGIDEVYFRRSQLEEDAVSDLIEEKKFGQLAVQMRLSRQNKTLSPEKAAELKKISF